MLNYDYDEEHISEDGEKNKEVKVSVEEHFDGFVEGTDVSGDMQNFVSKIEEAKWGRNLFGEVGNGEECRVQELISFVRLAGASNFVIWEDIKNCSYQWTY